MFVFSHLSLDYVENWLYETRLRVDVFLSGLLRKAKSAHTVSSTTSPVLHLFLIHVIF